MMEDLSGVEIQDLEIQDMSISETARSISFSCLLVGEKSITPRDIESCLLPGKGIFEKLVKKGWLAGDGEVLRDFRREENKIASSDPDSHEHTVTFTFTLTEDA